MKKPRAALRLKQFDYSQNGFYFVTICVDQFRCLFGNIVDDQMVLSEAGEMINKYWLKLEDKFDNVKLDSFVIMPNHFHGIIVLDNVVADPCVGQQLGGHMGPPLPQIIQWFKSLTTNEYIRGVKTKKFPPFYKKLWQRNYYEHVIRNEISLDEIRKYIFNNPINWKKDKLFVSI